MKNLKYYLTLFSCYSLIGIYQTSAQNPLILDQFTADPSARVFEGKVYIYPSHDIPCKEGQGFIGFCMADYHVFSSENLTQWEDHGVILSQNQVEWVDPATYSMWAPDCIFRNGRYYLYFPAISKEKPGVRRIGVATSINPDDPFTPQPKYIEGVIGIDPNPFIDKDGQAYLYWGSGEKLLVARLKENMMELASEPETVMDLPEKFKEGPYLFERKGIYYFTFPHKVDKTEQLDYAMGNSPMGPFKFIGTIMDEWPNQCWTNHQSVAEYKNQWYLFYHHNDLSPDFDKNRSMRADSLFFNADGTIRKVTPTLRGVGVTDSRSKIQLDRYSDISKEGATVSFLDVANKQAGWKTTLNTPEAWIRFNSVDFKSKKFRHINVKALAKADGIIEIRSNKLDGLLIAKVKIGKTPDWKIVNSKLKKPQTGIQDLWVVLKEGKEIELDWISFQ